MMMRKTLLTGLALCWLTLARVLDAQENPAAIAAPRDTTGKKQWVANHYNRMMALASKSPEKFKIVFVGDSITKKWLDKSGDLWAVNFGAVDGSFYALNLGVPGDRTEHVLYRLKAKADGGLGNLDNPAIQPEAIVLMIGTNNLFPPHTAEQIAGGIEKVALRLRELRPKSELIICSIIPCHNPTKNKQQVIPANKTLPALAERLGNKVQFLDLYPALLNNKDQKDGQYYIDGLHLNKKGYEVWISKLIPILKEAQSVETVAEKKKH